MNRIVIFLMLLLAATTYCHADDASIQATADKNVLTIIGQVSDIDWVASRVTVRYMQTQGVVGYDEVTLTVSRDTNIQRRGKAVGLSELQIGDQLTAGYINTSPGPLKALNIKVVGS